MATPVRREGYVPVPRKPTDDIVEPPVVLHTSSDLGRLMILGASVGVLLSTWGLFGTAADGMWAGYWCSLLGMMAIMAGLGLRTRLPRLPLLGTVGLCGGLLLVLGLTKDWGTIPLVTMVAGGAVMIVGAILSSTRGTD